MGRCRLPDEGKSGPEITGWTEDRQGTVLRVCHAGRPVCGSRLSRPPSVET